MLDAGPYRNPGWPVRSFDWQNAQEPRWANSLTGASGSLTVQRWRVHSSSALLFEIRVAELYEKRAQLFNKLRIGNSNSSRFGDLTCR